METGVKIGTKSVLFGAHQFLIHPWFVAAAWWKLYGFPWDPRLWVAFWVHDLGYWGKPNMDGPEGETHVEFGSRLMHRLFDRECADCRSAIRQPRLGNLADCDCYTRWGDFTRYHSRFYAKRDGRPYSRLCVADKLAIVLTPAWLYLPLVRASGEWREYVQMAREGKYRTMNLDDAAGLRSWYLSVQDYLSRWVQEHQDGRKDSWTPIPEQVE